MEVNRYVSRGCIPFEGADLSPMTGERGLGCLAAALPLSNTHLLLHWEPLPPKLECTLLKECISRKLVEATS
jgi:hypothetical protein